MDNYPQALTHLALIEAAMNLDEAGGEEALYTWATKRVRAAETGRTFSVVLERACCPFENANGFQTPVTSF